MPLALAYEKNMFVGLGGMQELPGQTMVVGGYDGGFGNTVAAVFTGVTGRF